jgi:hypothetical protein
MTSAQYGIKSVLGLLVVFTVGCCFTFDCLKRDGTQLAERHGCEPCGTILHVLLNNMVCGPHALHPAFLPGVCQHQVQTAASCKLLPLICVVTAVSCWIAKDKCLLCHLLCHVVPMPTGTSMESAAGQTPPWVKTPRGRERLTVARAAVKTLVQDNSLNPSQASAITAALTRTVTLWQGPPGTGKVG